MIFSTLEEAGSGEACVVFEARGDLEEVTMTLTSQGNQTFQNSSYSAGWHSVCFQQQEIGTTLQLEIDWKNDNSGKRWFNPLGLSGRGDVVLDATGMRLHWMEIDTSPLE